MPRLDADPRAERVGTIAAATARPASRAASRLRAPRSTANSTVARSPPVSERRFEEADSALPAARCRARGPGNKLAPSALSNPSSKAQEPKGHAATSASSEASPRQPPNESPKLPAAPPAARSWPSRTLPSTLGSAGLSWARVMLTRFKVDGFKNLDGVDVRFGPFTCIAGPNGVGKSNLFDAIAFLGALADKPLSEAAAAVRGSEGRVGDVRSLFRNAGGERAREMSFLAEMIIPKAGEDDLGSAAEASMTFLRYELRLRHRDDTSSLGPLEVIYEKMEHINKTGAGDVLQFPHKPEWRDSVIDGRRTVPYIETNSEDRKTVVLTRADSKGGFGGGGPRRLLASNMPRTVLSTANNAAEHRTLVLARREMMEWTQFQLEPSALRAPDPFNAPRRITSNGAHLPATLFGLAQDAKKLGEATPEDVYQGVANRLAELFENVRTLRVDVDEKRELYSILMTDLQRSDHPASSLSDGTLRFLALAILEASWHGPSLLCLEEPENGIHPDRIPPMIQLLQDLAVDANIKAGPRNPMRQVIVNTHSPSVVTCVPQDTLVLADATERIRDGKRERPLVLRGVPGTWRMPTSEQASLAPLLSYLAPVAMRPLDKPPTRAGRRVVDRQDVRQLGLFSAWPLEGE
jgi:predicted ATPase